MKRIIFTFITGLICCVLVTSVAYSIEIRRPCEECSGAVEMFTATVRLMMQKYADSARAKCPEIPEHVHPHLWRHIRAMHLYQHGMDLTLVSQWLGH